MLRARLWDNTYFPPPRIICVTVIGRRTAPYCVDTAHGPHRVVKPLPQGLVWTRLGKHNHKPSGHTRARTFEGFESVTSTWNETWNLVLGTTRPRFEIVCASKWLRSDRNKVVSYKVFIKGRPLGHSLYSYKIQALFTK